mgnify:CR=1 FL=1
MEAYFRHRMDMVLHSTATINTHGQPFTSHLNMALDTTIFHPHNPFRRTD